MRGFAKAFIAGNLTRDPDLRATPSGAQVANFSIAVNRSFKGSDGSQQEQVSYIECVAWGRAGETIAQYTKKGSGLLVSGRIEQRSWDDKNSGQKRSRTEIIVEDFAFLGGGAGGGGNYGGGGRSTAAKSSGRAAKKEAADEFVPEDLPEDEAINLDDIPF